MFTPSTLTVSGAIYEIVDTVGASGDSEMRTRALRSLAAGVKYLNGRYNWAWLLTEDTPLAVVAPFSINATASAGQVTATLESGHGVQIDDFIVASGFPVGTRVTATGGTSMSFNRAITGFSAGAISITASAHRDFYALPANFKQPYSFRLLSDGRVLYPANRRGYDRTVTDEFTTSTPQWYDLFASFQRDKVRLLPVPSAADTLQIRYYRRMTVPTATGQADVLDMPQDYDFHLVAWAKWHFLSDKEERQEQAQTWLTLANEGIRTMMADQTRQPDESLAFTPGHAARSWLPLESQRRVDWEYS